MKRFVVTVAFLVWFQMPSGCGREPAPGVKVEGVAALCRERDRYAGRVVTIEGIFQGWRVADCRFLDAASPAITRSDWLIRTDTECLYVSGGLPGDLNPANPKDVGRQLELRAKAERNKDGKLYLKYLGSRLINKPSRNP